ncbi:DUF4139 domain-containing protein [Paracrocinitomix mangrovi]|uniref:DUF4139 domain-containing protein n=1 Tax=Paracrocinitomix mangrovi TaxID=2862509 RepID=UPI001C8D6D6F|nr:DUF4139 domain-containing protein [Paracrocinitomix mangrovi]UKN03196.1 DUF4139 domain-containing protein [Paracrocinitomix mangrovi]
MKKIVIAIFALGLFTNPVNAKKEKNITSNIQKVTVYTQGAQVQRKASYAVDKGITTLIIEGVSPNIDPNSLQVQATGEIVILDSKYHIFYPQPDPVLNAKNAIPEKILKEIAALEDSLFNLGYDISDLQYKIGVLNSEKKIIENNGTIKGVGKVNDSIPLLKDAVKFYHEQMMQINTQLLKLDRAKFILTKEQNRMNSRLADLKNYNQNNNFKPNQPAPPIHQIKVTVSSESSQTGRIKLSYLVSQAGWVPMYDLRSSAAADKVDLTYKAHVYQNTGVDWEGVKLSLSTNNPYANKTKPLLTPWYLDYNNYRRDQYQAKKSDTRAGNGLGQVPSMENKMAESNEMELAYDDYDAKTAQNFTTMVEQLLSVEYDIDLPYDIMSDNEKNMVLVNTKSLNTEYMYYAVPKLDLSVYMVARISDLGDLNLIPGTANLFHDGAYLGNTWIDPGIMADTLDLSLGKDPNLVVKRTLLKNDSKERVVGDKVVKTLAYKIQIRNHKNSSVKLIVQDQVPISRKKEIEVSIDELSRGELNEITGIINWNTRIKNASTKEIDLKFTVKYDKTEYVNLAIN